MHIVKICLGGVWGFPLLSTSSFILAFFLFSANWEKIVLLLELHLNTFLCIGMANDVSFVDWQGPLYFSVNYQK